MRGAGCVRLSSTSRPDQGPWARCGHHPCAGTRGHGAVHQHVALPAAGQWDGTVALRGWGCGFLWWLWWLRPPLHVTTLCWGQGSCLLHVGQLWPRLRSSFLFKTGNET